MSVMASRMASNEGSQFFRTTFCSMLSADFSRLEMCSIGL